MIARYVKLHIFLSKSPCQNNAKPKYAQTARQLTISVMDQMLRSATRKPTVCKNAKIAHVTRTKVVKRSPSASNVTKCKPIAAKWILKVLKTLKIRLSATEKPASLMIARYVKLSDFSDLRYFRSTR